MEDEGMASNLLMIPRLLEVSDEFAMDFEVVREACGEFAEAQEGELAVVTLPFDLRGEQSTVARVFEAGLGANKILRLIIVATKIGGGGGIQRIDAIAFTVGWLGGQIFPCDPEDGCIALTLQEEGKERLKVGGVVMVKAQSLKEEAMGEFRAAGLR